MHIYWQIEDFEIHYFVFCDKVNKTSGLFWLAQAFAKLHALRLQGEIYYLKRTHISRVNVQTRYSRYYFSYSYYFNLIFILLSDRKLF